MTSDFTPPKPVEREDRVATALRENLRKRKQQQQIRAARIEKSKEQ